MAMQAGPSLCPTCHYDLSLSGDGRSIYCPACRQHREYLVLVRESKPRNNTPSRPEDAAGMNWFMNRFCNQCTKMPEGDGEMCKIYGSATNPKKKKQPKEWCYSEGRPTCTAFNFRKRNHR